MQEINIIDVPRNVYKVIKRELTQTGTDSSGATFRNIPTEIEFTENYVAHEEVACYTGKTESGVSKIEMRRKKNGWSRSFHSGERVRVHLHWINKGYGSYELLF